MSGKRAREADPPLLAVAQPGRRPIAPCGESQLVEDFGRPAPRLGAAEPLRHVADLDVLADRQPAKSRTAWKVRTTPARGEAVARQAACSRVSPTAIAPTVRPLEAGEDIDQRRLAGAVRSDQAEHLAALQSVSVDLIDGDEAAEADASRASP